MSVLIKGMKMPEHCGYCRFAYDGICHALQVTRYDKKTKDGKLIDCPLTEIPTPHGRLIDADALIVNTLNKMSGNYAAERVFYELCHAVNTAPTVIEAEGKE